MDNIFPDYSGMVTREDCQQLLKQRSLVIWFIGLSGSGKSTLAKALDQELHKRGILSRLLDGDNIRSGINKNLGFSTEDRRENIRRIAEVSKLFIECGVVTIATFISPTQQGRDMAREIIGEDDFVEVYVNTPIEECERRDIKGLYRKARAGEIANFTGISQPFEEPQNPTISIDTTNTSIKECIDMLINMLLPRISGSF